MNADLPAGLTTRPLTMDDAPAVFEAMAAQEVHDIGRAEVELADIVGEWQRPSYDVASSSVGVFDPAAGDLMVGYAEVGPSERGDAVVRPPYRGRGIGTWLAGWMQDTARARGTTIVGMPVPEGSDGDRLLTALGYHVRWTSWVLKLPPGATIVERPLPPGYAVRSAEPAEHRDAHTVVEDAFLEWSVRERESFEDFAAVTVERPGFEPWHLRVVTDESGTIVGVAVLSVYDDGSEAYISRLAVRRDLRGRGLAQALMVDAFAAAREHGAATAGLSTDSRTGALGLYEKVGMQVASTWLHRAVRLLPPGCTSRALTLDDAQAVHAVVAAEEVADLGRVTVDLDDIVAQWRRPAADLGATTVGVERDGVLIAYGELLEGHAFAAVHPEHQHQGIGRWVAQWLEDRARSLGWSELGGQVLQGGPADRLLRARGYAERWTAWDLELPDGVSIATVTLPDGYRLRVADAGDHEACWTVFEDAFLEWSDRERRTFDDFGALMWARPGFEPWNLRVVTGADGVVAGAAFVTVADGDAYLHKVAVRPDQRGRGLARVLLADAFGEARNHGAARALLSTDTRAGARGLYESVGMVVESTWVNRVLALA